MSAAVNPPSPKPPYGERGEVDGYVYTVCHSRRQGEKGVDAQEFGREISCGPGKQTRFSPLSVR